MGIAQSSTNLYSSLEPVMSADQKDSGATASHPVSTTRRHLFFEDPHFKETFDEFDKLRDTMFELRCMQDNVKVGCPQSSDEPLAKYEDSWMFPRKWMMPSLNSNLHELDLFAHDGDHEVIRFKEDDKQMEVSLDTSHYRPDELHVHVQDGYVTIDGKHEEKSEDGKRLVTRKFKRKYALPENARPHDVSSNLSSDGVLVVKALKSEPVKEVEIKMSD